MVCFLRRGVVGASVAIAVAIGWHPARADDSLAQARAAVDASDYMTAKSALASALASGTNGPDEVVEIYRLQGIVAGALGDAKAATEAFKYLLALSPKATLPAGTSPKISKPFAAASKFFASHDPLKVKTETASDPPSVTLVVVSDPLAMVMKARVWASVDGKKEKEKTLDGGGKDKITVELPRGKRLDLRVAAVDEHGNRLVELGSADVPIVVVGGGEDKPKPTERVADKPVEQAPKPRAARPLYLRWWMWAGAAAVIGGAGTYFGVDAVLAKQDLDALNADSVHHRFTEAQDVESRGHRDVWFANIGWGLAGALAIGAGVLYITEPHTETRMSIAPTHSGAAIVFGGAF
jgi:hypothetical protein